MRHLGRVRVVLFYGGAALEIIGTIWALAATDRAIPLRLAPLILGYALMLLAYLLAKLAVRYWSRPADPEVWDRIAQRLLEAPEVENRRESKTSEPK